MLQELALRFEAASVTYAEAHAVERDADWFLMKLMEEAGEVVQAANRLSGRSRRKGLDESELRRCLADETADLLGHVLLLAHHHRLDLQAAIMRKWRFAPDEPTPALPPAAR
ncbi:MazG nucleotide pyrophosphohydrolase domain-containing protein [Ciceribacter sp. RN22]|uniref:MazG nucleotide pyrophosphohydrolase domain-containing protein n=1 Tax=Ciceribacter sp. RN22 TaxID=2954932 RepID=UPI0020936723|nr:MazG nucleotide pyrophosphohydrolase domain-containing protein [Ciceribacter sp. RN22]MCO6177347.1 pyrophosphatase [Ciceribacter sp. RN22]